MELKDIITRNQGEIAFILGNGINRYPNNPKSISWENLLKKLWDRFSPGTYTKIPQGITITELYDLLDISCFEHNSPGYQIQKEVCHLLDKWAFQEHHTAFVKYALNADIPVLTTNFDLLLPQSSDLRIYRTDTRSFTDFYPWTTYYGNRKLEYPTDGFGIWFINGLVKYHRSIRLGLTHYMGSVEKARTLLHKEKKRRLFCDNEPNEWTGAKTWLHILFHRPLCIVGLGLEENEVFLRWLLIERAKYFNRFPGRRKKGWYVALKDQNQDERTKGKIQFLKALGFDYIETHSYEDMYEAKWL